MDYLYTFLWKNKIKIRNLRKLYVEKNVNYLKFWEIIKKIHYYEKSKSFNKAKYQQKKVENEVDIKNRSLILN